MRKRFFGLCLAALVGGCASDGLSPRESGTGTGAENVAGLIMAVQPTTQENVLPPATLDRPMRLAIAQVGEVAPPASLVQQLVKRRDLFATVDTVPSLVSGDFMAGDPRRQIDRIMGVARQQGDNYLLLYGGTVDQTDVINPFAVLDLTIVGCYVVPSHNLTAEGRTSAALIDLRDSHVVNIMTDYAKQTHYATEVGFVGARDDMLIALRDQIVSQLGTAFIDKVNGWPVAVAK